MAELNPNELLHRILALEQRLQGGVTGRIVAPVDAVFDLLLETSLMMQRQAEALEAAGVALTETAALVKAQAELFDRTVGVLRQPVELVKATSHLEPRA